MLRVGLTGNIASGKSRAASMFAELGAHVIDADSVAHDLMAPGSKNHMQIIEAFGTGILRPDGEVDRKILGHIVFSDKDKRLLLNRLIHPGVREEIRRRILDLERTLPGGIIIVGAALMVETGGYKMYDRLIVVTCDPALQLTRLMSRDGLSEGEAQARIQSQMPAEEKLKLADYRIDTSGTLKQTNEQVEAVYRDLLIQEMRIHERGRRHRPQALKNGPPDPDHS